MFVGVVLIGLVVGSVVRGGDSPHATVGRQAPGFSVDVIDGQTFELAEHLEADGRPLVLNLWASWCIPCRTEIPELSAFSEHRPDLRVIGVAVEDTDASAISFAREIGATYPLALGNPEFEGAYPRLGLPVTYIIGSDGVIRDMYNGILDEQALNELIGPVS